MKILSALALLAGVSTAPALFAADTNAPALPLPAKETPALQVNITDQADLIRQIGEEGARGFDPMAHARWLRMQIEALARQPATNPAAVAETASTPAIAQSAAVNPKAPSEPAVKPAAVTGSQAALREAIAKLRAMADDLEAQVALGK